jgi:DNA-binding transcriptional MerR regulator
MQYIKPVDVARQLGIADSTLRRYCTDFAKHLSPDAAPEAGVRRRFRSSDVAILKRAKELLDMGNTIEAANDLLGLDDFSTAEAEEAQETPPSATPASDATQALVQLLGGQVIAAQADQAQRLSRQDMELGGLNEQIADLRERLARAEGQEVLWPEVRERLTRMENRIEALQRDLAGQGDALRRDLEAHDRLLETLTQRLDAHDGQLQSIGRYVHDHSIKIGYRKVE